MKDIKNSLIVLLGCVAISCSEKIPSIGELKKFAATETFPNDSFLDSVSNKKALVVLAHDDDDCAFSGTIARLSKAGWIVEQLVLENTVISEERDKHPAYIIYSKNELIVQDGKFRQGRDTMKFPYLPIPKNEIFKTFLTEKVRNSLIKKINSFRPSVIFTLDNEMGGYGNPEHVFISQLVLDLYNDSLIETDRIYQGVYTDHMEKEIIQGWLHEKMKNWGYPDPYLNGQKVYNIDGIPEPTVQIYITDVADEKMRYLRAYHEDAKKNMRKFIPYYEQFDANTYFDIFDREFFRVFDKRE